MNTLGNSSSSAHFPLVLIDLVLIWVVSQVSLVRQFQFYASCVKMKQATRAFRLRTVCGFELHSRQIELRDRRFHFYAACVVLNSTNFDELFVRSMGFLVVMLSCDIFDVLEFI